MSSPSVFSKIIAGEIPSYKVYEDSQCMAFLDVSPEEEGHTLLVPKRQVDKLYDLDDKTYSHIWLVAKKLAKHFEKITGKRTIFHVIGVDVPHAHIHIVPYEASNYSPGKKNTPSFSDEEMTAIATTLRLS